MNAIALATLWLTVALPMLLLAGLLSTDSEIRRPVRAAIGVAAATLLVAFPLGLVFFSVGRVSITYRPEGLGPFPALAAREHRLLIRPLTDAVTARGERQNSLLWIDEQGRLLHCVNETVEPVLSYAVTSIQYRQSQPFLQAVLNDDPDLSEIVNVYVTFQSGQEVAYQVRRAKIGLLLGHFLWRRTMAIQIGSLVPQATREPTASVACHNAPANRAPQLNPRIGRGAVRGAVRGIDPTGRPSCHIPSTATAFPR